jgi:hypothetical protein
MLIVVVCVCVRACCIGCVRALHVSGVTGPEVRGGRWSVRVGPAAEADLPCGELSRLLPLVARGL